VRLAAIGDLHCQITSYGAYFALFRRVAEHADAILLAGDLTSTGQPQELAVLLEELEGVSIPIVTVLGNHEHEAGKTRQLLTMLQQRGVVVLGEGRYAHAFNDRVGVVGTKGFAGGFAGAQLTAFGEPAIKSFVHTAVDEAMQVERGLVELATEHKVVLLHYSPIRETVVGENPEIFAYLGSSRLEDAVDRGRASVVFHGHAHKGTPRGQTRSGVPVHNVALPLLRRQGLDALITEI
jgi:Icc-related predicted phosphoesterase